MQCDTSPGLGGTGDAAMAKIVIIHGMNQHVSGPHALADRLRGPLRDGLWFARRKLDAAARFDHREGISDDDVEVAFWGEPFRRPEGWGSFEAAAQGAVDGGWEQATRDAVAVDRLQQQFLFSMWSAAAIADGRVEAPGDVLEGERARHAGRSPAWAQRALQAIAKTDFFQGCYQQLGRGAIDWLFSSFKQMHAYMQDRDTFENVQRSVARAIKPETRVVIGHSLGSVIAYELLLDPSRERNQPITLITLGSPLGARGVIYEPLRARAHAWVQERAAAGADESKLPAPRVAGWHNVVDHGDLLAPHKDLGERFHGVSTNQVVYNGYGSHDLVNYLTAEETGRAVAAAL